MSTKPDGQSRSEEFDTSHYLGQLNQIYSQYPQSQTESWDALGDELKYELVIKSLFAVKQLGNSSVEEIKQNLQGLLKRGDDFTTPIVNFMLEHKLVTEEAGKIHLTGEGRNILK